MISGVVHPSLSLDAVTDASLNSDGGLPNFVLLRKIDPVSFPRDFNAALAKHQLDK